MFHIHTFEGVNLNIPLESLPRARKIKKNYPSRKSLSADDGPRNYSQPEKGSAAYAERAYRAAIRVSNEREPIYHAYKIMSSPVITIEPDIRLADAWYFLEEKSVSYMPVVSTAREILGIVSDRDLLKKLVISEGRIENQTELRVRDVMAGEFITSVAMTDIRRIAKVMFDRHLGAMPILNDAGEHIIGIITRSDILYALVDNPPLTLWG